MGLKPAYRIEANRSDITEVIRQRFRSMTITDNAGIKSDSLRITLADNDPTAPILIPNTGAELEVWIGYDQESAKMGLYVVDEVEISGPPGMMIIRAKAAPQKQSPGGKTALQTRKTRSWEAGLTLGGMVSTIAQEHGLTPAVPADISSQTLPHYDQVGESDMNLLTRVAAIYDALAKPADGKLLITPRAKSQTVSAKPLPVVRLAAMEITDWAVTIAERERYKTVKATWYDKDAGEEKTVSAGEGQPEKILRHAYKSEQEARSAATSDLKSGDRGQSTLSLTLPGRTDVIAEARLQLTDLHPGANGEWLINKATHTIDGTGYSLSVSAQVPE